MPKKIFNKTNTLRDLTSLFWRSKPKVTLRLGRFGQGLGSQGGEKKGTEEVGSFKRKDKGGEPTMKAKGKPAP